jgi:4-hydroxy-3-polyprenylbenzoate decarboxylase
MRASVARSARIWNDLDRLGVPGIKGVYAHPAAAGGFAMTVVSLEQRYPGHARQAMLAASQVHAGAYLGRYVIVVDEDIDPTNMFDVIWALASRSDPVESIEILRRCWSGPLDPRIHPSKKGFNSRAVISSWLNASVLKGAPLRKDVGPGGA